MTPLSETTDADVAKFEKAYRLATRCDDCTEPERALCCYCWNTLNLDGVRAALEAVRG